MIEINKTNVYIFFILKKKSIDFYICVLFYYFNSNYSNCHNNYFFIKH